MENNKKPRPFVDLPLVTPFSQGGGQLFTQIKNYTLA
jgi:hypothetical protein